MDFTWINDPTALLGLGTLMLLELVLGIDNLVFIAILAERLPPSQRAKARNIGLSLALIMRMGLLFSISWVVSLTAPLFSLLGAEFSGRDLILLAGGLFLLFKATMELHERLEGSGHGAGKSGAYAAFWQVVAQIVVLDAVFSLDSVITAVGMVDQIEVMMIAVCVAIAVMIASARRLTEFVARHPTVVILCLAFLLMIGLSLIAEGFDFHIPKGYLYAAIGFSVLIETFNQVARRNRVPKVAPGNLRDRTAEAVLRLLGGAPPGQGDEEGQAHPDTAGAGVFGAEERSMVQGVISLVDRTVRSIMTPRSDLAWLDLDAPPDELRRRVLEAGHSRFPVARGRLDQLVGVSLTRDLLPDLLAGRGIDPARSVQPALVLPDGMGVLRAMERLREARVHLAVVVDEFGSVEGVLTPTDLLEAIAGEFREGDEEPLRLELQPDGSWLVDGGLDLHRLDAALGLDLADGAGGRYATLAGHLMWRLGRVPKEGERLREGPVELLVEETQGLRPRLIRVPTSERQVERSEAPALPMP